MAENSKIEWTTHTFNGWEGCQKVGPGCDNCYAEARNLRFSGGTNWGPGAPRRRTGAANWAKPIRWNREAKAAGIRPRVFCASLADVFDNAVDPQWRTDLFHLIHQTPHLDWLLLTKRPGNIEKMLPSYSHTQRMWPNVWLGCTVVNQEEADRDIPKLLAVPAKVRFLSIEPMLGPINLTALSRPAGQGVHEYSALDCDVDPADDEDWQGATIDWVICGGESGPHARPMHPDWARSLRDQCAAAGVAFHFKQWGEWAPDDHFSHFPDPNSDHGIHEWFDEGSDLVTGHSWRYGKKAAGRLLDGREWNEVPA